MATWATDIDIRIDVEHIMRKLAEKYANSFKHLVALYAVTSQVTRKDAAALDIGRNPSKFPKYMKCAARMLSAAYA